MITKEKLEQLKTISSDIVAELEENKKTIEDDEQLLKVKNDFDIIIGDLQIKEDDSETNVATTINDTDNTVLSFNNKDIDMSTQKLSFRREDKNLDKGIVVTIGQATKLKASEKIMEELLKANKILGRKKASKELIKKSNDTARKIEDLTVRQKVFEEAGDLETAAKLKKEIESLMNDDGGSYGE